MKKYLIRLESRSHQYVTVEANSPEEAMDLAVGAEVEPEEMDYGDVEAVSFKEIKD